MAVSRTKLKPVSRAHPCEECGGSSKCSRGDDGLIMCGRPPENIKPGGRVGDFIYLGCAKGDNQFGEFRRYDDPIIRGRHRQREQTRRRGPNPSQDRARGHSTFGSANGATQAETNGTSDSSAMEGRARELARNMTTANRAELARELGLPEAVFHLMPLIGYSARGFHQNYADSPCWTFPETDAGGRTIGLTCCYPDGAKKAMPGGRHGLFVVNNWLERDGPVELPEGASDTLTMAAIGLAAVGRPSNMAGVEHLAALLRDLSASRPIVVVGEYDPKPDGKWPGKDGAVATAAQLTARLGRPVFWALPHDGAKDVRKWVLAKDPDPGILDEWHELGSAWLQALEGKYQKPPAASADEPFAWKLLDSATFAQTDYRPAWLLKRLMVRGQPVLIGGPKQCLKTSLLIDLAASLASGTAFLGEFSAYQPVRVVLLSGESGEFTLQETARRVCAAKGIALDGLGERLRWGFALPQLANASHLATIRAGLSGDRVDVLILDPLYLALLSGAGPGAAKAENLFDMGPLLQGITQACLAAGATPCFAHHTRKGSSAVKEPLDLDDLAFAGVAEFARQWILVSRRERYVSGTGRHELWLSGGGSVGHGGVWSVDVDEGAIAEDFSGRKWEVAVKTAAECRQEADDEKRRDKGEKQRQMDSEDDTALLVALVRLDPAGDGASYKSVQTESRLSDARMSRAFERLIRERVVQRIKVIVEVGNGARRSAVGIKRTPD